MELPSNTLLQKGKYKIIKKLGQGGFGIAYKAYHQSLQREVCIKEFFFSDLCERARNSSDMTIISTSAEKIQLVTSFKKKFIKEAQRLAKFQHPNIVQVMDNFDENNTAYFVMEYLDGGSLEELLIHEGTMTEQKAIETILPIIDAMETVHKDGLLHLDIKPANIMLRKNRMPVLIDFGISKYMELAGGYTTTAPVGISKGYAPLEQYGGEMSDFSKATDIYSICATLYRMVTGVTPPEPLQIIVGRLKSPLEFNSQLSEEFNKAIIKGLSVRANDRQQNMSDLIKSFVIKKNIESKVITSNQPEQKTYKIKKYLSVESFSEGLAAVKDERYGYIDKSGREVISCMYSKISSFSEGLASVRHGNSGYVDKNGNEVIPFRYEEAYDFKEGLACVVLNGKCGFIDKTGHEVIPCRYDGISRFSEGLAFVSIKVEYAYSKYGFVDITGREVIPCRYDSVTDFKEGLAVVELNGKYGFIDKTERKVIPCRYDSAKNFKEGLAKMKLSEKYGYIDKTGREVIPFKYDYAQDFNEGLACVELNGKNGFVDKTGREVIPCKYDFAVIFFEGLACVKLNGKYGFVDKTGREVIPFIYDEICGFKEGLALVRLDGKYGYIDKTGYGVIPCKYTAIYMNFTSIPPLFKEGLAMVTMNGKLGYINKSGREVILCKYEEAKSFSEGLASVKLNGKWSYIDKTGQVVLE